MGGKARAESFWEGFFFFFFPSLPPEGRRWDLVVGYDGCGGGAGRPRDRNEGGVWGVGGCGVVVVAKALLLCLVGTNSWVFSPALVIH